VSTGLRDGRCNVQNPDLITRGSLVGALARYFAKGLIAAVLAALVACLYIYASNARMLERRYPVVRAPITAASGPDAVQRGKRLADLTGCTDCHRPDLRGGVFVDEGWMYGRYYASNLTLKAQAYSDEDLARIVRLGVRPDGRGVIAMPSFGFVRLTDSEIADIICFIRTLPAGGADQPEHFIGPLDQWDLWQGRKFKTAVSYVAEERGKDPIDAGPQHAAARHIVGIVCAECHGGDLKGNGWDSGAPDLVVIQSYGLPELTRLLRTGSAVGERTLGLMTRVAKDRLRHLSDQEIADIHGYLVARAKMPSP
jgi:mono/diheme cytochrome c family protein